MEGINQYDDLIKLKLQTHIIPKGKYELGKDVDLIEEDLEIFKQLYPISPPKKNKPLDSAGSKGSGNGEIALYWLLNQNHDIKDGRGRGKPDFFIDGLGVEVKAYEKKKITLGRFFSDNENIYLLNLLFGLNNSISNIEENTVKFSSSNALNFNKVSLIKAFENLKEFINEENLSIKSKYLENAYLRIKDFMDKLDLKSDFSIEETSANIMKTIISNKFREKPGEGGYIVNISEDGKIKYTKITQEKINNIDIYNILDNVSVNQGQIVVNVDKMF